MKNILVPSDFNFAAEHAMEMAVKLAKGTKAQIKLMTMLRFPKFTFAMVDSAVHDIEDYKKNLKKEANIEIERWKGWYPDVKIKGIIKENLDELIPAILDEQADLIVMGSEGANGWQDYFTGTNAQNLVRKSEVPVLVVKEDTNFNDLKKVLFVTDFEKTGFVKKAIDLFGLEDTKNYFVHIDTGEFIKDRKPLYDKAKKLQEEYDIKNFDFEIFAYEDVSTGVVEYANRLKIDMIVMFTHGRKGVQRFLFGSVAENIANISNIPILSILEN